MIDKKYGIEWRDAEKKVLVVHYFFNLLWEDVLAANLEALSMLGGVEHNVVLFHNSDGYNVNLSDVGSVRDFFHNKLPMPPKILRRVVVYIKDSRMKTSLNIAMEILDKAMMKRRLTHFANTMEEAERLISEADI